MVVNAKPLGLSSCSSKTVNKFKEGAKQPKERKATSKLKQTIPKQPIKSQNKENQTIASPDLSDISLCSPLHISTPTHSFKNKRPAKKSQSGALLSNTLLSQFTTQVKSDPKVHKARLFGDILGESPESGFASGGATEDQRNPGTKNNDGVSVNGERKDIEEAGRYSLLNE